MNGGGWTEVKSSRLGRLKLLRLVEMIKDKLD